MNNKYMQYMVDFTLPANLPEDFVSKIPQQRKEVNKLLQDGTLLNYALSLENAKLWAVFSVDSYEELIDVVSELPLTSYMQYDVHELTFFNATAPFLPAFSVN